MEKEALSGKTLAELKEMVTSLQMPGFSAKQIADWLYKKKVRTIDEMTNLSLKFREKLTEKYEVGNTAPEQSQKSADGTVKYLFRTQDNKLIESVFIPEKERATLCISSQVGCKMNCLFCMTGKQGFSGNLSANEILNQIFSIPESDLLTNVVFMGMGEPLDNFQEVKKVIEILTADYGYTWSPKRITLSTIGIKKEMQNLLNDTQCHIAVSLHSPFHEQRLSLMPMEKINPVREIIEQLKTYDFSRQRRLSFEYIIFKNVNDSQVHAKELVKLLSGLECRINLIRFHKIPGVELESPNMAVIEKFQQYLNKRGIICTLRKSRGEDILAACGMLSGKGKDIKEK
ncbi:MAG: 23S rRNA (adenine(2503)-C(2))-methyltransferase RlmN [Candidatus Azobacteroides sp.]|nr:23S rRNA (adenine(2503)-C(2))-methyltransferase RlmN [Candidatus Azobacteroides sp.]